MVAPTAHPQPEPSPHPQFDVAILKSSPPPEGSLININLGTARNGRLTLTNASLSDCIRFAYGLISDAQLIGPDWIKSKAVRFDVVAQAPRETPRSQLLLMLQTLLADRLQLKLHPEQRELAYLALVPAKNGPRLQRAKPDAAPAADPMVQGRIVSNQMPMDVLATLLSRFERQVILNRTGLQGLYEVKLEWESDQNRLQPLPDKSEPAARAADSLGPSIFTALQEQLGLRLESRKGPVDVLVVDGAQQVPAEN